MRLLITGSRGFDNRKLMHRVLLEAWDNGYRVLIHGAARGADRLAAEVGERIGFEIEAYPVRRQLDGPWPAAGVKRNSRMLEESQPHICFAFPLADSRGTWDMVNKCKAADVPYVICT